MIKHNLNKNIKLKILFCFLIINFQLIKKKKIPNKNNIIILMKIIV